MKLPSPLVFALEVAFNKALELDEDARERFIRLSGKVVGLDLKGLDIQLYLMPALDGVNISSDYEGQVDAWIRGAPFSLLHTAMTHERDRLLSGDVEIEGDIELGQKVQNILRYFEFDWEELLSKRLGDIASHQIGQAVRSFLGWGNYVADALARDSAEYFQEERRDIVGQYEIEQFNSQVDETRMDVERLEQRINRLAQGDVQA